MATVVKKRWDKETIAIAILTFWKDYGRLPTQVDWNPAAARAIGHEPRAQLYEENEWPSPKTVRKYFGTWSEAMVACGFEAPTRGRPRGVNEQVALERGYRQRY